MDSMDLTRPISPDPYSLLPQVPSFTLSSQDIADGEPMDEKFTADGGGISPQLTWTGFPDQTESFLVTCFDPDAPTPSGYWHWNLLDLPASTTSLDQGIGESDLLLAGAAFHVRSDGGSYSYEGVAPPPGDRAHRYYFAVHALDVDSLELNPDDSPTKVAFTAVFHTLARAILVPTFQS